MKNLLLLATTTFISTTPLQAMENFKEDIKETKSIPQNLSYKSIDQLDTYIISLTEDLEKNFTTYLRYLASPSDFEKVPPLLERILGELPTDPEEKKTLFSNFKECEKRRSPITTMTKGLMEQIDEMIQKRENNPYPRVRKNDDNPVDIQVSHAALAAKTNQTFKKGLGVLQLLLGDKEGHMTLVNTFQSESSKEAIKNSEIYLSHFYKHYQLTSKIDPWGLFDILRPVATNLALEKQNIKLTTTCLQQGKDCIEKQIADLMTETSYSYYKAAYEKKLPSIYDAKNNRLFVLSEWERSGFESDINKYGSFNEAYAHYIINSPIDDYCKVLEFGRHRINFLNRTREEVKKDFEDTLAFYKNSVRKVAVFAFNNNPEKQEAFIASYLSSRRPLLLEEALKDEYHWAWGEMGGRAVIKWRE